MTNAYAQTGLNQPADAATAWEIVTQQQPSSASYGYLAEYAYLADQIRKGDLAAAKAVSLSPSVQQRLVRAQLASIKRQVLQQAARGVQPAGGAVNGTG